MHWHALFHWRRCSPHTRIFAKPSAVLSSSSPHCCTLGDESITPNSSFRQHSTPWDALSPTFCNFSVSTLGHGCTSCFSSNCLAIALLGCHLMRASKPLCCGTVPQCPTPVVHSQSPSWSLFWRRLLLLRRIHTTCKLPPTVQYKQNGIYRITQVGRRSQRHESQ